MYNSDDVSEIVHNLKMSGDEWSKNQLSLLSKACPLSLKWAFHESLDFETLQSSSESRWGCSGQGAEIDVDNNDYDDDDDVLQSLTEAVEGVREDAGGLRHEPGEVGE